MRYSELWQRLGQLWCRFAHDDIFWPVKGKYECRRCLRVHAIPWADSQPPAQAQPPARELAMER
ncbi:MAG: hypothetical protein JO340_04075 [Acidobacteriaceae bacterium]|nr:hypothetical protein [Acidobacteriaceae bacterium]